MSTSNQFLEQRICIVIRKAGGKLSLSDLVFQYKNEFQLSFPDHQKLSKFVSHFDSIQLQRNPKNNQTYILESQSPKIAAPPTPKKQVIKNNVDENQYKDIEKRIIDVLKKSNNRILLNHFHRKYQDTFNEVLLVPAGIKTRKWFEKFQGIQVEHDKVKHQVHLVLPTQEEKLVRLLQDHDGCIGLSRLVHLYQKKYSEDLLIPMGKRLSHWIRSFTSLVLTERPSNNEICIYLKQSAQRQIEALSNSPYNIIDDVNQTTTKSSNDQRPSVHTQTPEVKTEETKVNATASPNDVVSRSNTTIQQLQPDANVSSSIDHSKQKDTILLQDVHAVSTTSCPTPPDHLKQQTSSPNLELTPLIDVSHDEEDLSDLIRQNKDLSSVIDEALEERLDAITSLSNDIQMINESENVVSQNQSLPIDISTLQSDCPSSDLSPRHNLSLTEDVWQIIEDDQKEEMIVDAIQSLGYSLVNTDLETSAILVDKVDVEEKV